MRKAVMIVGAVIVAIVVVMAAVLIYAARNLDSIIAERQPYLLERLSDSLGRKVEVAGVKVSFGWGLVAEFTGVKIADDPALSDQPFVLANNIYANVDLMPLLSRHIHVTEVRLKSPEIHVIRTEEGSFNISTIGRKPHESAGETPEVPGGEKIEGAPIAEEHGNATAARKKRAHANLGAVHINSLSIDDAVIVYEERGANHQTATIHDVDLTMKDFTFVRAFDVSLKLAMLSDKQNVDISGSIGPLASEGALDAKHAHLALEGKVGPLDLARLRAIGSLGMAIPEALSVPDPIALEVHADGTPSRLQFHFASDLTGNRVAWADSFDKPASVPLRLNADGTRSDAGFEIAQANATLSDLDANLRDVKVADGDVRARVDTNRFDIGAMAKLLPTLQKYNASGHAELHAEVELANRQPRAHGTLTLAEVALARPGDPQTLVKGLSGEIQVSGNAADALSLKFDLGSSGHAIASLHAHSLQPLSADYVINVDAVKVSDFAPKRPDDEHLNNLALKGTVAQEPQLALDVTGSSSDGNLANIAFKNLSMAGTMRGKDLNLQSLKLDAFNGDLTANGSATLGDAPQFALNLTADNVDIQSALQSQQSKSADMVQGILDARLQVSGKGANFDDIKPTLAGDGHASMRNGKLIGINLASEALKKTKGLPGIGDLLPPAVVERHQELFNSPDTQIDSAGLTFALRGTRLTSHDIAMQTPDYGMTGDGWFDMDKNIEMAARLLLTKQLSNEIIAEKKNVVYVTDKDDQVDIPMLITGKLPKAVVVPDIAELAQRAGDRLIEQKGEKALGKLLGKKGKGLNIPFLSNGGGNGPSNGSGKPPDNPLDQLKGLFH